MIELDHLTTAQRRTRGDMRRPIIASLLACGCGSTAPASSSGPGNPHAEPPHHEAPDSPSVVVAADELQPYEAEPRMGLQKLHDSISAWFAMQPVSRTQVAAIGRGERITSDDERRCPSDGRKSGSTPITPPLLVDCPSGPNRKCVPTNDDTKRTGHYAASIWLEEPAWLALKFQMEAAHRFHFRYSWTSSPNRCEFVIQAIGRGPDGYRIYERRGTLTPDGSDSSDLIVRDPRPGEISEN